MIQIIESPREGMQGFPYEIPAGFKIRYIRSLLQVGFHTVELGSIVNPKFVPAMADTLEVIRELDYSGTSSERMVLVMNRKGAELVVTEHGVTTLAFPFSFSPAFLMHNARTTVNLALRTAGEVVGLCAKHRKEAVIYISYAFGNPYGDPWNQELLLEWAGTFRDMGIRKLPLSNVSVEVSPELLTKVFTALKREYPAMDFGLHLHTGSPDWEAKVHAAYEAGCRRFDSVINGAGGCPMSGDRMLGNLATQNLIRYLEVHGVPHGLNLPALEESIHIMDELFERKWYI